MLRVYACIAQEHDIRLVAVAAAICLLASLIAFSTFDQARRDTPRVLVWASLAAIVAGLGIWATHFVAMLAYEPQIPIGYSFRTTLLSVSAAIGLTGIGWVLALSKSSRIALLGGAVIGAGVAAMHYIGMASVRVAGLMAWDRTFVSVSVALGVGLATAAVAASRAKSRWLARCAPLLLTLAICGLHFTAMAAVTIYPMGSVSLPRGTVEGGILAIEVIGAVLLIQLAGFGVLWFERKLARVQLAQTAQRAAVITNAAIESMAQGLVIYDEREQLVVFNHRFAELHGIPQELLAVGTPFVAIADHLEESGNFPLTHEFYEDALEAADAGRSEVHLVDGRIIEIHILRMPSGGWLETHEDVTEARESADEIAWLAAHDGLTGLPNRVTFAKCLVAAFADRRDSLIAVHTIDLDRFKEVNDTLGHPFGDKVLKETADRLRQLVRKGDVVTRNGGDEFAIIQQGVTKPETAAELAGRIIEALNRPFEFDGHTAVLGGSVGIGLSQGSGTSGEDLIKMSDLALYQAKGDSRGTYRFFEPGMDDQLRERRELEADLREAIREGQFELHYQPVLCLETGAIDCMEALVRWNHPDKGKIPPAAFIPIAESSNLILPIGEWVLREACSDAAQWPGEVKVAVNLSTVQFKRSDLIALTMSALAAADLEPGRLELEITESVLLNDEAWMHSVLQKLTALGTRIALDDFGTGYSSLSYLHAFPFSRIKIDRSFVGDLSGPVDSLAIIQATMQLAHKLGLETTAEGVETADQLDTLAAEGCTHAQGFFVSPPVPAADVAKLLAELEPRDWLKIGTAF
jgi:diguanylate cyclase (GGDEF)-like protein